MREKSFVSVDEVTVEEGLRVGVGLPGRCLVREEVREDNETRQ